MAELEGTVDDLRRRLSAAEHSLEQQAARHAEATQKLEQLCSRRAEEAEQVRGRMLQTPLMQSALQHSILEL